MFGLCHCKSACKRKYVVRGALCLGFGSEIWKSVQQYLKKWELLLPATEEVFKFTSVDSGAGLKMQMLDWYILLKYSWLNYSSLCCKLIDFALCCSQKGKFLSVCTVKVLICVVAVSESSEMFWGRQGNQTLQCELLQIHIGSNFAHRVLRPQHSAKLRAAATLGQSIRKLLLSGWVFASVADQNTQVSFLLATDAQVVWRENMLAGLVWNKLPHSDVVFLCVASVEPVTAQNTHSHFLVNCLCFIYSGSPASRDCSAIK